MTIEEILKAMVENSELALHPGGFRLVANDGRSVPIRNSRFYELLRDGHITFCSIQGHFDVDVIKLGLTPKGREVVEEPATNCTRNCGDRIEPLLQCLVCEAIWDLSERTIHDVCDAGDECIGELKEI